MEYKAAHYELMPCPRCGTHPMLVKTINGKRESDGVSYSVYCARCKVEYPKIPNLNLSSAVYSWNTKYANPHGEYWVGVTDESVQKHAERLPFDITKYHVIKMCPLCGGEPSISESEEMNTVVCTNCNVSYPNIPHIPIKAAVYYWNDDASYWWMCEEARRDLLKYDKEKLSDFALQKFRDKVTGAHTGIVSGVDKREKRR